MTRLSNFVQRYAWPLLIFSLAVSTLGGIYSVELFKNLRPDIEELLPTTARSVIDLNEVSSRLEAIESLAILVFSDNTAASKKFVDDLASRLNLAPKNTIASVEYKITAELAFFKKRRALYMDTSDLMQVRNYVKNKIEYEKQLYNPLNIFREENLPEPKLDFGALRIKYEKKTSAYSRFPDGYYATPNEKKRVVLAYMPGKVSGIDAVYRLKNYVLKTIEELNPASYSSDLKILYTGGVQNTIEEQSALIADLLLSTVIVSALVSAAMFLFFRAILPVFALLIALFMGTFWTFGTSYFAVGYLNANSAFLGSIVLGNGINFGIIFLARYLEERRRLISHEDALSIAMTKTHLSTLTAALAAALSYGSLVLTGFRGFRQFGVIGLMGMVLCWIATYTVLPVLLTLFHRFKPLKINVERNPKAYVATFFSKLIRFAPKTITFIAAAFTVFSLALYPTISTRLIETDLSKLRNKESMTKGSGYLSIHVDEIMQRYLSPAVILPHSADDAQKIGALLKEKKRIQDETGATRLIASVQTLEDFLPNHQKEKIALIKEIRSLLPPKIFRRLDPSQQKLVRELLEVPEVQKEIQISDLPKLILDKFTEKDGTIGKLVLVEPPITNETLDGNNLMNYVKQLRQIADSVAPGSPVAGALAISSDMIEAITLDGPKATFFAFLAVILLVVVLFRSPKTSFIILFALLIGVIWMGGIILWMGTKINFLNFIAFPITFGIGVDYGVNIFQRYREEGSDSILRVIRETGGAVALCSFTTVVGYGSLLIAQNQAFVSFGLLAILGEITCLLAATFALPALLLLFAKQDSG